MRCAAAGRRDRHHECAYSMPSRPSTTMPGVIFVTGDTSTASASELLGAHAAAHGRAPGSDSFTWAVREGSLLPGAQLQQPRDSGGCTAAQLPDFAAARTQEHIHSCRQGHGDPARAAQLPRRRHGTQLAAAYPAAGDSARLQTQTTGSCCKRLRDSGQTAPSCRELISTSELRLRCRDRMAISKGGKGGSGIAAASVAQVQVPQGWAAP